MENNFFIPIILFLLFIGNNLIFDVLNFPDAESTESNLNILGQRHYYLKQCHGFRRYVNQEGLMKILL